MGLVQESLPYAAIYNNPAQLTALAGGVVALGSALKSFEVVHTTEVGILMRSGNAVERSELGNSPFPLRIGRPLSAEDAKYRETGDFATYGPGVYIFRPFIDKLTKIHVGDHTHPVEEFNVTSVENKKIDIRPHITWHIRPDGDNPYKALMKVYNEKDNKDKSKYEELSKTVLGICVDGLRLALAKKTAHDLVHELDAADITATAQAHCEEELLVYGCALKMIKFNSPAYADAQIVGDAIRGSQVPPAISTAGYVAAGSNGNSGKKGDLIALPGLGDDAA